MQWYGNRTGEERNTSRYRAHLSVGLEGRLKEEGGREAGEDHGRTVRIRRLDHGLACHGRSQ